MARTESKSGGRSARIAVRLTADAKARIVAAAKLEGQSTQAFVLAAATEAANRVLATNRIELGEAASVQIANRLNQPARAIPELADLFEDV